MSKELCPPTGDPALTPEQLARWCERVRARREEYSALDLSDRTHLHLMGLTGPWRDQVLEALQDDDVETAAL